jgi:anti-anti-sigma regulatory factor
MEMIAVWLKIDEERLCETLEEACDKLDTADGELMLDFSSVRRIEPAGVKSLEHFATAAQQRSIKVAMRGVNIDVYKVLKLVDLTSRFTFVS